MDEGGVNVLPGFGGNENPGSRVVHILGPVQGFVWYPKQDSTAVIQVGGCMNEGLNY